MKHDLDLSQFILCLYQKLYMQTDFSNHCLAYAIFHDDQSKLVTLRHRRINYTEIILPKTKRRK